MSKLQQLEITRRQGEHCQGQAVLEERKPEMPEQAVSEEPKSEMPVPLEGHWFFGNLVAQRRQRRRGGNGKLVGQREQQGRPVGHLK